MRIAPSILNADFEHLQTELDSLKTADRIHLDIMDGHYVPHRTFQAQDLEGLEFPVETETHLMCERPEMYFDDFQKLGTKGIIFHLETTGEAKARELLQELKHRHIRPGICIDTQTHPESLTDSILEVAQQVIVMSVQAGAGGQTFLPESLEKCQKLRAQGYTGDIEFDGGVNLENTPLIKASGGDIVVVGSFLMGKPPHEREAVIQQIQAL